MKPFRRIRYFLPPHLLLALLSHGFAAENQTEGKGKSHHPVLHGVVSAKHEVRVPAQDAGVLLTIAAEIGTAVKRGDLLACIDDLEPRIENRLAQLELETAQQQATNDVNVRYAQAAAGVAEAEFKLAQEVNLRVPGTKSQTEIRRLELAAQRAKLQMEQAAFEQKLIAQGVNEKAELTKATAARVARRKLFAPIDGEVVAIDREAGEWVSPGEPVVHIVGFETLQVEAFVKAADFDPEELAHRPVTLLVEAARGRKISLSGKITQVSNLVESGGVYRILALIPNQREGDSWLLRPGTEGDLQVHLK